MKFGLEIVNLFNAVYFRKGFGIYTCKHKFLCVTSYITYKLND